MLAAWYEKNGPAAEVLQVGELPDPVAGPGEVRVRLYASGVNPSDVKARAGNRKIAWERIVPDSDGAGVIDQVGEGVDPSRIGQRVWTYNAQWDRPYGTSAQYVALPEKLAIPLADKLTFAHGACLGIPVMTAHRCLFAEGPVKEKTVLVTGGAGVVAHYAIQLAKWAGARVVATVSSEAKAAHARTAGADLVINYRTQDVVQEIRSAYGGVDRVVEVDFGRNLPITAQILNPDAAITSYASLGNLKPEFPYWDFFKLNVVIRPVFVYTMADEYKAAAHADIVRWLQQRDPLFAIAAHFPLDEVVAAHETVERGEKLGHILIDIP